MTDSALCHVLLLLLLLLLLQRVGCCSAPPLMPSSPGSGTSLLTGDTAAHETRSVRQPRAACCQASRVALQKGSGLADTLDGVAPHSRAAVCACFDLPPAPAHLYPAHNCSCCSWSSALTRVLLRPAVRSGPRWCLVRCRCG
jgi:hypothetical protein